MESWAGPENEANEIVHIWHGSKLDNNCSAAVNRNDAMVTEARGGGVGVDQWGTCPPKP